ncbi:HEPN domain-containing protein [Methanospirillum sp. J.3.6.1-F.2.7.3]|uniref:HEPN domain-containing protein n=1 Tax=Methanospirillum purgamenti TaxID=2834276 RepID=A0A8E7B008_9EURY|nr:MULTISPECIES: HEPN domain-containing protein [Methanospirillum]MDX8551332.1 HEPN domain-containing protein [Methanospirillum hungatei]QVV87902.1 HEPN domain-containing protein [Methanospirillum sp. J.3.6.1-F.2.7.3]
MSNNIETIRLWCLKADSDLKNASHEIEHEDPALDTICFHAQQTIEKYLKAFLVFSDTEIPKTHSLIRLIRDCILIDTSFSELIDKNIDELTDFAVEIRYADEFYFPSIEEARDAIEKAEFVRSFVLSRITLIKQ